MGEMAKTILIADDDPAIRKTLCKLFEAEEAYEICAEASTGLEAVNRAETCRPDLIILDLSMPVMGGLSATKKLTELMPVDGIPEVLNVVKVAASNVSIEHSVKIQDFNTRLDRPNRSPRELVSQEKIKNILGLNSKQ
jgi:CheY-like chemotaxis protein